MHIHPLLYSMWQKATFFNATGQVLLILECFVAGQIAIDCIYRPMDVFGEKFNDLVVSKLPPKWCHKREMFH